MSESLGNAVLDLDADTGRLTRAVSGARAHTVREMDKAGKVSKARLTAAFVAIAAAAATAAYRVGVEFDDAFDTIRVETGKTGKELAALENDFREVVKDVPANFEDASTAVAEVHKRLDLTGKPLRARAKQFLELSRITGTDVKENVALVTRAFGDWEIETDKQGKTLDFLFRASQRSGASVGELAQLVVQFGAPLRQVGFSLDQSIAMFSQFEKAGVNIATMMPGLKMALKGFLKDGRDPAEALRETFEGIKDGSIDSSEALKIFGQRAGPDMVEAIRQGRFDVDKFAKTLGRGGDTIRKAGRDTMDFEEQLQLLKNRALIKLEPIATRVFAAVGREAESMLKVLSDPKLTNEEKLSRIVTRVAKLLSEGIERGAPLVAKAAAAIAPAAAMAFVTAFTNTNVWGKVAIGAFIAWKLGAFGAIGRLAGRAWVASFSTSAATGAAGGARAAAGAAAASSAPFHAAGVAAGAAWSRGYVATTRTAASTPTGGGRGGRGQGAQGGAGPILAPLFGGGGGLRGLVKGVGATVLAFSLIEGIGEGLRSQEARLGNKIQDGLSAVTQGLVPKAASGNIERALVAGMRGAVDKARLEWQRLGQLDPQTQASLESIRGRLLAIRRDFPTLRPQVDQVLGNLRRLNAGLASPQRLALEFGVALQEAPGKWRGHINAMILHAKRLPPAARIETRKLAAETIDNLERTKVLSSDQANKMRDNVRGAFGSMERAATRRTGQMLISVGTNMGHLVVAAGRALRAMGIDVNGVLKALGVNPVKFNVKTAARSAGSVVGALAGGAGMARGGTVNLAGGGVAQFGRAGDRGPDAIPAVIGGQRVVVGSGEVAMVATSHQQKALNARLADVGGITGFFRKHDRPHYMATGGMVGAGRLITASHFGGPGDPGTGHIGYRGDNLYSKPDSFAELNMGSALGGLPYLAAITLFHKNRSEVLRKRDIGLGGPGLAGTDRAVDVWFQAADDLGFDGLALMRVALGAHAGGLGEIARRVLEGPDGAMRSAGQGALDKAHKAANQYIDKQIPTVSVAGGGSGDAGANPRLYAFARFLQSLGYRIGEFPPIDPIDAKHGRYGPPDHYNSGAIDVTGPNLGRVPELVRQWVNAGRLALWGPGVLWQVPGHYGHVHVSAHARGGLLGPAAQAEMDAEGMPRMLAAAASAAPKAAMPQASAAHDKKRDKPKPNRRRDRKVAAKRRRAQKTKLRPNTHTSLAWLREDLDKYDADLEQLEGPAERQFGLMTERFDLTDEEALVRLPDGSEIVNWDGIELAGRFVRGINHRLVELTELIAAREGMRDTYTQMAQRAGTIAKRLRTMLKKLRARRKELHKQAVERFRELRKLQAEETKLRKSKPKTKAGKEKKQKRLKQINARQKVLGEDLKILVGDENPNASVLKVGTIQGGSIGALSEAITEHTGQRDEFTKRERDLPFEAQQRDLEVQRYRNEIDDLNGTQPTPATADAGADTGPDMSEINRLLQQKLTHAEQRLAVSEAHRDALHNLPTFGGIFHQGGIVPGRLGEEVAILAQAGERVTPINESAPDVRVVVEDRRVKVYVDEVEQIVQRVVRRDTRGASRGLPGGVGVLR